MSQATFLELHESVGVEPSHLHAENGEHRENPKAGELGPLVAQGIPIPVPVRINGTDDFTTEIRVATIQPAEDIKAINLVPARIVPGTRIIETNSPPIAAALLNLGYRVCDPPANHSKTRAKSASGKDGESA